MKIWIAIILFVSLFVGCTSSTKSNKDVFDIASIDDEVLKDTTFSVINLFVGEFVKGINDTLILLSKSLPNEDMILDFSLHSIGGSVPEIYFGRHCWVYCSDAGDLDGNGTNELCVCTRMFSTITGYNVISFSDGAGRRLTDEIHIRDDGDVPMYSLVQKSNKKGYIQAKTTREIYTDSLGNKIYLPVDFNSDEHLKWDGYEHKDTLLQLRQE